MPAAQPRPAPVQIRTERPEDAAAVEALVARAFGPGRFTKVSYRVRDLAAFRRDLSFVAEDAGRVVGTVRLWEVGVARERVLFLGPIAVEQSQRGSGLGAALVRAVVSAADEAGEHAILLVGDAPFFAPFGFERARAVTLPGPANPARVLIRTFDDRPQPEGAVTAPPATTPAA
jgi:predicted N-acetyltransferase YhbS